VTTNQKKTDIWNSECARNVCPGIRFLGPAYKCKIRVSVENHGWRNVLANHSNVAVSTVLILTPTVTINAGVTTMTDWHRRTKHGLAQIDGSIDSQTTDNEQWGRRHAARQRWVVGSVLSGRWWTGLS